jgi:hypothetical protein
MRKITLDEHIIASASEMRELESTGVIEVYEPKNSRHKFFHNIKTAPYRTYKGSWGTEHIKWDGEGAATVRVTQTRAREIKHWFSDQLFGNHNE